MSIYPKGLILNGKVLISSEEEEAGKDSLENGTKGETESKGDVSERQDGLEVEHETKELEKFETNYQEIGEQWGKGKIALQKETTWLQTPLSLILNF